MKNVLKIQGLCKNYKAACVLQDVSITIESGEIYGLIGRNGVGKTTLMKTIIGSTSYQKGTIELFDNNALLHRRNKIGCIIEIPAIYPNMTAYDNLKINAKLIGEKNEDKLVKILNKVGVIKEKNKKVETFSAGMKQRLAIAIALLGNPEFLILDEPINGLDPIGIKEIRKLILDLQKEGVTFLISSHILDEMDKVANKFGFLENGKILCEFTQKELEEKREKYVILKIEKKRKAGIIDILKNKYNFVEIDITNQDEIIIHKFNEDIFLFYNSMNKIGIPMDDIIYKNEDLEEIYMRVLEDYRSV